MNDTKFMFLVLTLIAIGSASDALAEPPGYYGGYGNYGWTPPKTPVYGAYGGYWNGQIPVRDPYATSLPYVGYPNPPTYGPYGANYQPISSPPLPAGTPDGTVFVPRTESRYDRQLGQRDVTGDLYRYGQYVGSRTVSQGYDKQQNYSGPVSPYGYAPR